MSVLYTVFGAGWGGGMLTFLLELAHMVVRSINCVLSFSCTQGWYQGYQGWLSHHQKKQVIYSYIFRIKFGHMVKSRVKFSALTAVVLLQRNYRGRSPRREGWGLWRHQWKGQTCQTYPQDPWEIIESLNHCLIKNLLATFAVAQTCWSTLTCKISAWTTAKMLADLRKSRSWAGLLVLRCYLPWFLLVDSKVCISRSGCDFHFCLVKAPACLTIKTPAGKASTSFPLRRSKQSGPGVRLWRMDAPRTKK